MRLLISFFLALFLYSAILFFFLYFVLGGDKKNLKLLQKRVVYIHRVVIPPKKSKNLERKKVVLNHKQTKNREKKVKKKVVEKPIVKTKKMKVSKELKSRSNFSQGGKVKSLQELFKGVKEENIKNDLKYHPVAKNGPTKRKGESFVKEIEKDVKNLDKLPIVKMSNIRASSIKERKYIETKFAEIWNSVSRKPNDFVKLNIEIENGKWIKFDLLATNLDTITLNNFLDRLKSIDITAIQKFEGEIVFKSELKEQ